MIRDNLGGNVGGALDTLEEIEANTESGKAAGALAVKEILTNLRWYIENGYLPDPNSIALIPTMTSATTPSGVASASTEYSTGAYPAWKAFDNDNNTYWNSAVGSMSNQWLQYQFPNPVVANRIKIQAGSAISYTLQGSNNGIDFVNLSEGTLTVLGTHEISFDNTTAYQYYRLANVNCQPGDNAVSVYSVQLYGKK